MLSTPRRVETEEGGENGRGISLWSRGIKGKGMPGKGEGVYILL